MRPVKLDFFDHPFTCPLCKEHIVYPSMYTLILESRRKCPSCKGELLIEQGVARAISDKKPPKRASADNAKRSPIYRPADNWANMRARSFTSGFIS